MNKTQKYLIEYLTRDIILYFSKEYDLPFDISMDIFIKSDLFDKLQDIENGLYTESASYIYEMLQSEIKENTGLSFKSP